MIEACLKNPVVEGNLTILEMMYELDKLKQENEELSKERDDWKEGFTILHNKMEEQKQTATIEISNNGEGGFTPEEFDELEYGYSLAEKDCVLR